MPIAAKVYSAESQIRHPGQFVREASADLRASRGVAARLFRQSIAHRYRHSSLGLLWAFAPPLITALLLTFTRGRLPASQALALTPPAFYAVFGLMLAQTFLEALNTQRTIFSANRLLLGRQKATIESLILAGAADSAFGLGVKLIIVALFAALLHVPFALTFPLGLLGMAAVAVLGAALGLLIAPISALKPDMDYVMTFFPWILFALTPVFIQVAPGGALSRIYRFNPLAGIFDAVRAFTYGDPAGHGSTLLAAVLSSICLFLAAALFCRIARPYVAERFLK